MLYSLSPSHSVDSDIESASSLTTRLNQRFTTKRLNSVTEGYLYFLFSFLFFNIVIRKIILFSAFQISLLVHRLSLLVKNLHHFSILPELFFIAMISSVSPESESQPFSVTLLSPLRPRDSVFENLNLFEIMKFVKIRFKIIPYNFKGIIFKFI